MDIKAYRDEIKLKLTGGRLKLEISDSDLDAIINSSLREIQRYIDITRVITIPYKKCIDMSEYKCSSVSRVFRAQGYMSDTGDDTTMMADPVYLAQWQILGGNGALYNFSNWVYNYGAWNTMLQIRNTISTDLAFKYVKEANQLYINTAMDTPSNITIEYVPRYDDVSEITSDFWIDQLMRLSLANTKIIVGRIRSKFNQSNALWGIDGETMVAEGKEELTALQEALKNSTQLVYPID